jgi:LemA protein
MIGLWIALGVVALLVIVGFASYNRFVRQRQLIKDAWANIDTELKRRIDLIPNLIETVKGYASHERDVLERLTAARAAAIAGAGTPGGSAAAEGALAAALKSVFAVAEAYPDLKASANFVELQHELSNTEDRLQAARRFYNGNVRDYNTRVNSVPSNLVARIGGFTLEEFFEVDEALRSAGPPKVDFS